MEVTSTASGERANIRVPVEVTSIVTELSVHEDVRWIEELKEKCERAFNGLPWLSKLPDSHEKRDPKIREDELSQPKVVTIGPFYRDETMPIAKEEKCLIVHLMNHLYDLDLADYLKKKEKQVADALAFYSNISDISSHAKNDNRFAEMLLLDSYFILFMLTCVDEILSKVTCDGVMLSRLDSSKGQKIMLGPEVMAKVAYMLSHKDRVMLDLLIVDNQIPFFVIEEQFKELKLKKQPLHKYALEFFETIHPRSTQRRRKGLNSPPNCEHLLHLFHWSRVPENKREVLESWRRKLDDVYWGCNTPNLAQLRKSAVVFEKKTSGSSLDVTFRRSRLVPVVVGVIDIPRLHIHDYSSRIFHNLIAFEMQRPSSDHRTMAFVVIMRNLLQSEEDVKLLRQRGILANALTADSKLVDFFKSLSRLTENYQMPIDVYVFCRQVLSYYNRRMSGTYADAILKCFPSW